LTEFLPGRASLPLDLSKRIPNGQHNLSIAPGHGLAPTAIVTLEVVEHEVEFQIILFLKSLGSVRFF